MPMLRKYDATENKGFLSKKTYEGDLMTLYKENAMRQNVIFQKNREVQNSFSYSD